MAKSPSLRLGQIRGLERIPRGTPERTALDSVQGMLRDIEQWANLITYDPAPDAADIMRVLVREPDGNYKLWTVVAGAGVTVTKNAATRVLTIQAP